MKIENFEIDTSRTMNTLNRYQYNLDKVFIDKKNDNDMKSYDVIKKASLISKLHNGKTIVYLISMLGICVICLLHVQTRKIDQGQKNMFLPVLFGFIITLTISQIVFYALDVRNMNPRHTLTKPKPQDISSDTVTL